MFNDVPESHWAYKSIDTMFQSGMMSGDPDGNFRPDANITRAEIASIMSRVLFRLCLIDWVMPKILPAIFTIMRGDGGSGTGFYVSPDGYFVTAKHVVDGATAFTTIDNYQTNHSAKLVAVSDVHDLALLKIDVPAPAVLKIATGDALYEGKHIAVIGSPKGYIDSVTQGVVSSPHRPSMPMSDVIDVFQTDAAINPGNSGGPVVDGNGDVVGVAVWKFSDVSIDNMGFSVRYDSLRDFLSKNGLNI